jgi:hypothetical protein
LLHFVYNRRFAFEISLTTGENWPVNQKICIVVLALVFEVLRGAGQGTTFYYQGSLSDGGSPANGQYDLQFSLYNASTNGSLIAGPLTNFDVTVSGGLFSTNLDFGPVFTGASYWLAIGVRTNGSTNAFTGLLPRQAILPVPYAIFANTASNLLGTLAVNQLAGTLSATQLAGTYSSPVSFTNTGNTFVGTVNVSGTFSGTAFGNGAGLTNLNGSYVASGTVADARLSSNVAFLNGNQTFTGTNTFTNWNNSFTGNFFGNGLVGWVPVSNTSTQAVRDTGYLLLSSGLTTVTLPASSALQVGDIIRVAGAGTGGWTIQENSGQSIIGNLSSYKNCLLLAGATGADWRGLAASANGSLMYAAGNFSGGVWSSTSSGQSWNSLASVTGTGWFSIACSADGSRIFVAPSSGPIIMSTNGGLTWSSISSSLTWSAIACNASGSEFVAAVKGGYVYTWNSTSGFSANLITTANWTAVACSADGTHMAAAYAPGLAYISVSSGANGSWSAAGSPTLNWTSLFASSDGQRLVGTYVPGAGASGAGYVVCSANFGSSWYQSGSPVGAWKCVSGSSDASQLVAGVSNGLLYASANFGSTWSAITTTNQNWSGVCVSADGSKFAGAVAGTTTGGLYYSATGAQYNSGAVNGISGNQGSSIELQYIGNNQFMPLGVNGVIWAN